MKPALRRGFKTEANDIAEEVRAELRLPPIAPLDPWRLADHLEIPVWGLGSLGDICGNAVTHFSGNDPSAFSAVTVFQGVARVIVHNDTHAVGRQSSNLAHELSHALLLHPPAPAFDELGCRDWDPVLELEADWLAGALLIPDAAALWIVRRNLTDAEAAEHFRVSIRMLQFRLNVTGARKRVARAQARRRAPAR